MSIIDKTEKEKMAEFIKNNPITYICEDCGREHKDRIPFPEGCECGNVCEDFFREKEPSDIKDEKKDKLIIGVKYNKKILKEKKDKKSFKNKIANASSKESLNDIKKKDIIKKRKTSFNRFEAIKGLYKSGDYTYKELMKKKNKELKKILKGQK